MNTAQGDFVCNKESNKNTIEHFVALPGGTYKNSCRNCSYVDNKLKCDCKKINGNFMVATKYCTLNNIENSDGFLLCK